VGARAGINAQGNLDGLAGFSVSAAPPTIAAKIELAQQLLAGLQAAATFGIEPPDLSLQLSMVQALLQQFQADMSLYLSLLNLGGLSAFFYSYHGQIGLAGSQLATLWNTGLPGGTGSTEVIQAAMVATNVLPTVGDAIGQIMRLAP
jgi:hypothetical protein